MPGLDRQGKGRVPDFYLSPSANGVPLDSGVYAALAALWPWLWIYVGQQLGDSSRAADLADIVGTRVSRYVQSHPNQVRSLPGLCRVAAVNLVASERAREARIEYRGLARDFEAEFSVSSDSWDDELELAIWIDQVLEQESADIKAMLELRLLDHTWTQVGKIFGLSGGQARLRVHRAFDAARISLIPPVKRGFKS